ncbi:alpha/beta fold hydrolase [Bailinhaonella thermotolerans]|uniref:Alpha/beta fold hydrolase n=1 Tax=Bailinhaonella thermotolerans TaxID=1070861 RepID=A0A3A4ASK5_9ACTN|nr:alpha/beta fold hydrolase [Bailinhaonella thermotolerans]
MFDPFADDPPAGLLPPAETPAVTFESGGVTLPGVLHVPAGPGPHPIVVLLHGFPGNERNFDLAQVLRRAGYATVVFHYRGSWGAGGTYSWGSVLEDAARVVRAVREEGFAAAHRLDPERLAVAGHSLGGFAALRTAAGDPSVRAVASIAGFDLGIAAGECAADPAARAGYVEAFGDELLPLAGTSGEALIAELEAAGDEWRLRRLAPRLADRPVLLVAGERDDVARPEIHHHPLVAEYAAHPVPLLEHRLLSSDHALSGDRVTLARTLLTFLTPHLNPTP